MVQHQQQRNGHQAEYRRKPWKHIKMIYRIRFDGWTTGAVAQLIIIFPLPSLSQSVLRSFPSSLFPSLSALSIILVLVTPDKSNHRSKCPMHHHHNWLLGFAFRELVINHLAGEKNYEKMRWNGKMGNCRPDGGGAGGRAVKATLRDLNHDLIFRHSTKTRRNGFLLKWNYF